MTTIRFKAIQYSGGTSYIPIGIESEFLMQHCLNNDLASINHNGMEKLKIIAKAHGWEVVVE